MFKCEYTLRKIIEGYLISFDFITFAKVISKESIFVFDRLLPICDSVNSKMKFTGHWLQYSTMPNVATLIIKSLQAIKFVFILFAANLTLSLLIFNSDHGKVFMPIYQSLHLVTWQFHQQECADMAKLIQYDNILTLKHWQKSLKLGVILLTGANHYGYQTIKIVFNQFWKFTIFQ